MLTENVHRSARDCVDNLEIICQIQCPVVEEDMIVRAEAQDVACDVWAVMWPTQPPNVCTLAV